MSVSESVDRPIRFALTPAMVLRGEAPSLPKELYVVQTYTGPATDHPINPATALPAASNATDSSETGTAFSTASSKEESEEPTRAASVPPIDNSAEVFLDDAPLTPPGTDSATTLAATQNPQSILSAPAPWHHDSTNRAPLPAASSQVQSHPGPTGTSTHTAVPAPAPAKSRTASEVAYLLRRNLYDAVARMDTPTVTKICAGIIKFFARYDFKVDRPVNERHLVSEALKAAYYTQAQMQRQPAYPSPELVLPTFPPAPLAPAMPPARNPELTPQMRGGTPPAIYAAGANAYSMQDAHATGMQNTHGNAFGMQNSHAMQGQHSVPTAMPQVPIVAGNRLSNYTGFEPPFRAVNTSQYPPRPAEQPSGHPSNPWANEAVPPSRVEGRPVTGSSRVARALANAAVSNSGATVAPRVLTPEPSCANHGPIDDVLSKEVDRLAQTLKLDPADRWKITPTRAEPQALYTCPWSNCGGAQIGGTIEQINHHFRLSCFGWDLMGEFYHDTIPVKCAFPDCDKTVTFKAIARHVAGVHFNSLAIRCPFPGCGTILSRESNYQEHYLRHIRVVPGAPTRRGGARGKQPDVIDLTSD